MYTLIKLFVGYLIGKRKTHFLIVLQNNNELRATGGFITKVLDIYLGRGKAEFTFLDVFTDLDKHKYVEPPKPIQNMLNEERFKGWTFRDANFDPDFNKTSKKLVEFYKLVYPENIVSGVIAVNFSFIEDLLEILGPIQIDKDKISKENLFSFLSAHAADIDRHDLSSIKKRKEIINHLFTKLLFRSVFSLSKWGRINRLINKSFNNKNLQIWLAEDKKLIKFGQKKQLPEFNYNGYFDCLSINESNFLGGKSNRYIKRSIFRDVSFTKKSVKITVNILWEHLGKHNYPISTNYRSYVRIYIPKEAEDVSVTPVQQGSNFKIIDFNTQLAPGEKTMMKLEYSLSGNWLDDEKYKFKYIKQSGVYDETLTENITLPIQYKFTETPAEKAITHENTCSIKHFIDKDIKYNLKISKNIYGPRIIAHNLITPSIAEIKFSESVHFLNNNWKDNIVCYHKERKKNYPINDVKCINEGTVMHVHLKDIPKKENEFYVLELSNIVNKIGDEMRGQPRKATVVYRSRYFR